MNEVFGIEASEWAFSLVAKMAAEIECFEAFAEKPCWSNFKVVLGEFSSACGLDIFFGQTRAVIVDEAEDRFVLKIQYRGYDKADYCASEAWAYQKVCDQNLEQFFAAIAFIGKFKNLPLYVMEKCDVDEDKNSSLSEKHYYNEWRASNNLTDSEAAMEQFYDEVDESEYQDTEGMLDFAAAEWGYKDAQRVRVLWELYQINDCHVGNWGWRDGELVITDYAGFCVDIVKEAEGEKNNEEEK